MSFFGDQRNTFFYNKQTFELDCGARVTVDNSIRELSRLAADIARRFVDIADIFGTYESTSNIRDIRVAPIYADFLSTRTYRIEKEGIELLVEEVPQYDAVEFKLRVDIRSGPTISVGRMTTSEFSRLAAERIIIDVIATDLANAISEHIEQWVSTNELVLYRNERESDIRRAIRGTTEYARVIDGWPRINPDDIWGIRISGGNNDKENEKAKKLLLSCLTKQQKNQYKKNKWFIVRGNETGLVYRIRRARQINVDLMDGDVVVKRLCTVPDEYVPIEDHMLAQKLMLETDEMDFLARAIEWSA